MKYTALIFIVLFRLLPLFAQTEKGLPSAPETAKDTGVTRAVVIGISDYQNKDIPDLQYSHKDAEAFAQYLRSPAGGSLSEDDVQILLNEKATAGRFAAALDWLMEQSKPGDRAIIYFSGHGDVERKTLTQPGFLLCWDAPARVYMAGGTFGLAYLQEVISTLSIQNKARVVVITDACHAGKLAGSSVGGAQLTGSNLAKQFANETKILSCQPNEFSLEGSQWGSGRGVFSYHLIDGLTGLADRDSNATVNLFEVGRYLEDKVATEAAPHPQLPMTVGDRQTRLALVDAPTLIALRATRQGQLPTLSPTGSKNLEDEVLARADSLTRAQYYRFKEALASGELLEAAPGKESADALFSQLIKKEVLQPLHGQMRRNFAATLQDESQQVINSFLKTDLREITRSKAAKLDKYRSYPPYLDRAAQLLGEAHYLYPVLMSRKKIFEGFILSLENRNYNDPAQGEKILQCYKQALLYQPESPLALFWISRVYVHNIVQLDSAELYVKKAMEQAPTWVFPAGEFAFVLTNRFRQFERARQWLDVGVQIDSSSAYLQNQYGIWYAMQGNLPQALALFRKAVAIDSSNSWFRSSLAHAYQMMGLYDEAEDSYLKAVELAPTESTPMGNLGNLYFQQRKYPEAEYWYKKGIQLDSTNSRVLSGLGILYSFTDRAQEAIYPYQQAIRYDSTNFWAIGGLAKAYIQIKDLENAEKTLNMALKVNPNAWTTAYYFSLLYTQKEDFPAALEHLEKALKTGMTDVEIINSDPDLAPLRAAPEFKSLMKKHFSEKFKD